MLNLVLTLSDLKGAEEAIKALENFFYNDIGLASRLSNLGIDDTHFEIMAKKAVGSNTELKGISTLTPEEVVEIFKMSL